MPKKSNEVLNTSSSGMKRGSALLINIIMRFICHHLFRYLANEKRDKIVALSALEECKAAAARDKLALESKV